MRANLTRFVAVALAAVALILTAANIGGQLFLDLTIAGLTTGAIAALSGVGVVVTYRATGVFNFAHGAIAVFVAYVLWQLNQEWGVPLGIAAPIALLLIGPGLGVAFERSIFRPLSKRQAATAEQLVATVGLFVVLLGAVTAIWGLGAKTNPTEIFPGDSLCLGACADGASGLVARIGMDQLGTILTLIVVSAGLWWLFQHSRLGTDMKAVVDRRELAELTAVDANRVSAVAWAMGAGFAGLTGVLLAPVATGSLDPFRLTLLVIETFAVAVVARLTSLPRAVAAGLGIGLLASYLTQFSFAYLVNWVGDALDFVLPGTGPDTTQIAASTANAIDQVLPSIMVFIFFGALVFMRSLQGVGESGSAGSFVARISSAGSGRGLGSSNAVAVLIIAVIAVALPFMVQGDLGLMRDSHRMLALAVVFLSIVVVTGFSGHITLAQAGFAGVGALTAARVHNAGVPVIWAMLIGGLVCVPIGLVAGFPALKRRGLFLGLTTLALGMVLERGVLQNLFVVGNESATTFDAPNFLGLTLDSDISFYFYELTLLGIMVLLARNLRRSQLGRVLAAMRDSETGARSVAINLRRQKLMVFSFGAFMAGIGGAMLAQSTGTYSPEDYLTINGLLWFAVVVVAGVGSIHGALLGAFLFTLLGSLVGEQGLSTLIVGLAAVSLGRLPGGLVGAVKRLATSGPTVVLGDLRDEAVGADDGTALAPSEFARDLIAPNAGGRR